ncbi:hypothetical protein H6P81_017205 [Aristolochia fimbriata]|uniref:Uncharacterized protein n=1 Tax=Aristolochia fimbriata TaxID=158543 RepID=A0AAV7DYU4_ARIFI|nr:hypothetical protein H6P81_017205 [Aristolochia fimbriata]
MNSKLMFFVFPSLPCDCGLNSKDCRRKHRRRPDKFPDVANGEVRPCHLNTSADFFITEAGMVGLSVGEKHFIKGGIAQDLRCDGRKRLHYRPISVETGVIPQANGSARIRLGATEVIASVKAELGKPSSLQPGKGKVAIFVECSPTAAPMFEGRGGEELSNELSTTLQRCLLGGKSGAGAGIDLSSLMIVEGKICWDLYIDGLVISSDGNILDTLGAAIKAALSNTAIPKVIASNATADDQHVDVDVSDEEFSQFDTSGVPVIVTLTKVGRHYIVDATPEEESQMSSAVSVSVNRDGQICGLSKRGSTGLDPSVILDMISVAKHQAAAVHYFFRQKLSVAPSGSTEALSVAVSSSLTGSQSSDTQSKGFGEVEGLHHLLTRCGSYTTDVSILKAVMSMNGCGLKIFHTFPHEAQNQFEGSLEKSYEKLQSQLVPPFPLNIPSPSEYLHLNQALVYAMLTQPQARKVHLTHLHASVTDGYELFVSLLLNISNHFYHKLQDCSKSQLLWITSQLISVSAIGIEKLLVSLFRQAKNGDFSDGNLWICSELVKILLENWDWVTSEPDILTSGLFVYLRLLSDHCRFAGPKLEPLKKMEINFCLQVLRKCFNLCLRIGRDLIRLLQDVVHIPEFGEIWKDLLVEPSRFGVPEFESISQIYKIRTSSKYFLLRIVPEMEVQLRFLLSHVKWGGQKRYQVWFANKFLNSPESEFVISDLIRFICCAHHPSNEILQSNVISRWAIVGWLLKCCRKNHTEANAKLALFYDWLFFDERIDNIMNIEPAILLIVNSIPSYMEITHGLLEFLFLLVENYDLDRKNLIACSVTASFEVLVRKGVINSLEVLTSCNSFAPSLRARLMTFVPNFKSAVIKEVERLDTLPCIDSQISPNCQVQSEACLENISSVVKVSNGPAKSSEIGNSLQELGIKIEQSMDMGVKALENILFSVACGNYHGMDEGGWNFGLHSEALASRIADIFRLKGYEIFPDGPLDDEIKSATALLIRFYILSDGNRMREMVLFWSRQGIPVGAHILSYASRLAYEVHKIDVSSTSTDCLRLSGHSEDQKISSLQDEKLENSLIKYHFDAYLSCISSGKSNKSKSCDEVVPSDMLDDLILDQLVVKSFHAYRNFLELSNKRPISSFTRIPNDCSKDQAMSNSLLLDVKSCSGWDRKRSKLLFQSMFRYLPDLCTSNENLILLLVDLLDYADIMSMQFAIGLRRYSIFGVDGELICHVVQCSFKWDSVKQQKFWGLLVSELLVSNVQVEKLVMNLFSYLSALQENCVAVAGLITLLRSLSPTQELVGLLLCLPDGFEDLSASVLASWVVLSVSLVFRSLTEWLENQILKASNVGINYSTISTFLKFLELEGLQNTDVTVSKLKARLTKMVNEHT